MYRLVLCAKYLLSRWLTLVATAAVFLGVGTLIVVLAVMGGFVKEVRDACRGGLSDVIIDGDVSGFPYYDEFIEVIKRHPNVAAATPVVQLYGLIRIKPEAYQSTVNRPCIIHGVRPEGLAATGKFGDYLLRQKDFASPTFDVPAGAADRARLLGEEVYPGCIPGLELVSYHPPKPKPEAETPRSAEGEAKAETPRSAGGEAKSEVLNAPGAKVVLTTFPIAAGGLMARRGPGAYTPTMRAYTVVDYYKSRLYEFDSKFIFIPFAEAQKLGELGDPSGENPDDPPRAHHIRVRLRDYGQAQATIADLEAEWARFRAARPLLFGSQVAFQTWEERQAVILGMVEVQRTLMIILLGLVVVVAGFLIGAILTMIVKEKTRDIGILKSLGASDQGAAQIFLWYAAVVSGVGALAGLAAGKIFIFYIDGIEQFVSRHLGFDVFPRELYYFDRIPRYEDPRYAAVVVAGAILWAMLCSSVAAWRAARLQPVEALRYE